MKSSHNRRIQEEPSERSQQTSSKIKDALTKQASKAQLQRYQEGQEALQFVLNQGAIEEALTTLIARRSLPVSLTEWPEFRALLVLCNPTVEPLLASRYTIQRRVTNSYAVRKAIVQRRLHEALSSQIHFTNDLWTYHNHAYQAVVAHFIDDHGKLQKALLGLKHLERSHSGEAQAERFYAVLQDWGLQDRIGYFMMDNASSNDSMLRHIAANLGIQDVDEFVVQRRLRCIGHIINLTAQTFLFDQDPEAIEFSQIYQQGSSDGDESLAQDTSRRLGAIGKLHNLIVFIRASSIRFHHFLKISKNVAPILDNSTRWNSWFYMLERAQRLRQEITQFERDYWDELQDNCLSMDDWQTSIVPAYQFLGAFNETTKATESDESTLDQVLIAMDFLMEKFEHARDAYQHNPFLTAGIVSAWMKLSKYYTETDKTAVYAMSLVLHPTYKLSYIEKHWDPQWVANIRPHILKIWEDWPKEALVVPLAQEASELTGFAAYQARIRADFATPRNVDEFTIFLDAPSVYFEGPTYQWWTQPSQRQQYPNLFRMAMSILAIPAMSAEPERVFSGASHTLGERRDRLLPEHLEQLECIKHWAKSGLSDGALALSNVDEGNGNGDGDGDGEGEE